MDRKEAFEKLLAKYQCAATDYDEGEEEDPRPYLDGTEPCSEWVCVTINYSSHGSGKHFFLPTFDTWHDAAERAIHHANDDLFEELPVAVVSLDTHEIREPKWQSINWMRVA